MALSSDTKKVFGMCLAVHFGFTEEVKEDENGREEGEEGEEEEKEVDESIDPSPLQHSSEVDESVDPTPYHSSVTTPEGWYYDPDADYVMIPTEEYLEYVNYQLAVADAERSVCRLRFLLLQKG